MVNLPNFVNGTQGSASEVMGVFQSIFDEGTSSLNNLTTIRNETLLSFQRRVSYINSKQQTANKLVNQNALVNFSLTDFSYIDQSETTATVRVDSNVVSSSEQAINIEAIVKSIDFQTNLGTVETISLNKNIYRVYNTNNQVPTGNFLVTLRESVNLSVLVFDLPSIASNPVITVSVSNTNLVYTPALSYSLNGYRLVVYLKPAEIQYIKLAITPTHPDNLGGSLYTFGVTDFVGNFSQYRLLSNFVTKPFTFTPTSVNCQLSAVQTDGLLYFLSFNGGNYIETDLNTSIPVPGMSKITNTNVTLNSSGLLSISLNPTVYLPSLQITDVSTGLKVPLLYNLPTTNTSLATLNKKYISVVGNNLYYILYANTDSAKTFSVSYLEGPSTVTAQLKVQISTNDRNLSPIFNGAVLLTA